MQILPQLKQDVSCIPCMAKLDNLHWQAGMVFSAYGAQVGIRVNNSHILKDLPRFLPPNWKLSPTLKVDELYSLIINKSESTSHVRRYNMLYKGWGRIARSFNTQEVFEELASDLHFSLAQHARNKLFVHAGVVSWHGKAIIIPGRTLSGKTTLVKELVAAGATYYSDEYAVFDERGYVHPYPKPLSVRQEGGERPKQCSIESLGGRSGKKPVPVGLVVLTQYQTEGRWRPRAVSAGQSALALLDNTIVARERPDFALKILHRVTPNASTIKSKRGAAHEVAGALLHHLTLTNN